MSIVLTQGRSRVCKENISGVDQIWLAPFVNYFNYQIVTSGSFLTEIPATVFYRFFQLDDANFTEPQRELDGGKIHEQNLTFNLSKIIDGADAFFINSLVGKDFRVMIKDRNGIYRILGLLNGMTIESIDQVTGGAKNSLNGYQFTMKGEEEFMAHFITSPEDVGIEEGFLLLETSDFVLLEGGGKIIL